ncbi:MAG TPA: polysaccharide biosynthesis/export family protein, partial [Stellaceae bacterium]|nr:polysaccharide biosynthesis/export family protein [Stellaceae bacterium]
DVVKIDDAVLTTLLSHPPPAFPERFKKYTPPPEIKLAVGDKVSVVIWESGPNGLFGNSLTELTFPAGSAARLLTEEGTELGGVPGLPGGLGASPELLAALFGAAGAEDLAGAAARLGGGAAAGQAAGDGAAGGRSTGAAEAKAPGSRKLQQFLDTARQSSRAGTRIPDQFVGADGAITIPYAGRLPVAGRTPSEVERAIEQRLGPKALEPQALVVVKRSAANSVSVAGEIVAGKRIRLSPGGDRLMQVIAAAGGAKAPVDETFVRLSRDGVTATVPLSTLVADPDQDIFVEPGDVLTVVRQPKTFSVFGAAARSAAGINSTISFLNDRLSLSEALARAGGLLDDRADASAVFLFRYEPESVVRALGQPIASGARDGMSPVAYRLDLKDAKSYLLAKRFPVRDKDIIFVANAETASLYYFFQALSQITGPVTNTLAVCSAVTC